MDPAACTCQNSLPQGSVDIECIHHLSLCFAGATNPLAADPGSIRGQYAIDVGRNIIHGSDAVESAKREIGLWFPEGLAEYRPSIGPWVYEKF